MVQSTDYRQLCNCWILWRYQKFERQINVSDCLVTRIKRKLPECSTISKGELQLTTCYHNLAIRINLGMNVGETTNVTNLLYSVFQNYVCVAHLVSWNCFGLCISMYVCVCVFAPMGVNNQWCDIDRVGLVKQVLWLFPAFSCFIWHFQSMK